MSSTNNLIISNELLVEKHVKYIQQLDKVNLIFHFSLSIRTNKLLLPIEKGWFNLLFNRTFKNEWNLLGINCISFNG